MRVSYTLGLLMFAASVSAQSGRPATPQRPLTPLAEDDFNANKPSNTPTTSPGQEYQIGPDDLIEVAVFEVPELATTGRVTASGNISVALLGPIAVAGHTPQEVERN